ncbi:MAG TPA: plastocyanin/azurin family copper-binding protein [Gaiellaceae bacterium]|nr:plastocyanin/azurin family copper-binding protein [Gaiellaceae bacterium]
MRRVLLLAVAALAVASVLGAADGAAVRAQATMLTATVGPEFSITLRNAQGARVTRLDAGTYEIEVDDRSDFHNFRLRGPGVNRATSVEGTGKETWTVTLAAGTYTFLCDPHSSSMRGSFVVGSPPTTAPPPPNVVTARTRLVLTSGPGFAINLRTAAGQRVTRMRVGTYTMVVRDRSRIHNARVVAPGYRRATTLRFVGQQRWRVRLARPGTLRFLCDPHAGRGMRGTARIVR